MEYIAIIFGGLFVIYLVVSIVVDVTRAVSEDRRLSQPGTMDGEDLIRFDEESK